MDMMTLLQQAQQGLPIEFADTMAVIGENYHYQPTAFSNGLMDAVQNAAGQNEGSCKIFAFAKLHDLSVEQTLHLFGGYYRDEVLSHPDGNDHANIRRFMRDGWNGIQFSGEALLPK